MPERSRRRARRRELVDRILGLDHLWSAGAVLALVAILVPQMRVGVRDYRPGDVAVADVVAPVDFQVEDPVSTERRRQEAVERVWDVYDYDPGAWREPAAALNRLLSWGRQMRGQGAQTRWEDLAVEGQQELRNVAAEQLGRPLPEGLLGDLWREGFTVETELAVAEALKAELEGSLVGNAELIRAGDVPGIVARDIQTQRQRRVTNLETIIELETAREAVRQRLVEALELPPEARQQLASVVVSLLRPNLTFNSNETQARRRAALAAVEPVYYEVKQGRNILREGDEVTEQAILELRALREQFSTERGWVTVAGLAILVTLAVLSLWRYVLHYRRRFRYQRVKHVYPLLLLVLVGTVGASRLGLFVGDAVASASAEAPFNVAGAYHYGVPFAVGALVGLLLVDAQVAWVLSAVTAVVIGAMTQQLSLALYALLGSFAAIYGMSQYKQRTALLRTGMWISGVNVAAVLGFTMLEPAPEPWAVVGFKASCGLLGGFAVALLASAALPALEHIFNTVTDIKLLELSNMNLPLLRQLAVKAPGTYHHSVVVGTLAEAAAEAIGANPLLCRVGAYYHDVGKVQQPRYFVENQREGDNPHDKLSPHMSALVLANHVKEGVTLAEAQGLPGPLVDMIPQHHGTRLMTYFYDRARKQADPDVEEIDPDDFRYPGPKPQTKEAAILMLTDGVEAASRALDDPGPGRLRETVEKIIHDVLDDGQLDECGLTLADLSSIRDAFLNVLEGMHHQRIEYPELEAVPSVDESRDVPEGATVEDR